MSRSTLRALWIAALPLLLFPILLCARDGGTTGTIIMHMRTRARLSRKDEQALLKFLAP